LQNPTGPIYAATAPIQKGGEPSARIGFEGRGDAQERKKGKTSFGAWERVGGRVYAGKTNLLTGEYDRERARGGAPAN